MQTLSVHRMLCDYVFGIMKILARLGGFNIEYLFCFYEICEENDLMWRQS